MDLGQLETATAAMHERALPSGSQATSAVVLFDDDSAAVFTQQYGRGFGKAIKALQKKLPAVEVSTEVTYPDPKNKKEKHAHAEMLALSVLIDDVKSIKAIVASQGVCGRCAAVLDDLKIKHAPEDGAATTDNWVSPYYMAGRASPNARWPDRVTGGKYYVRKEGSQALEAKPAKDFDI
jgi:hypothetical protein